MLQVRLFSCRAWARPEVSIALLLPLPIWGWYYAQGWTTTTTWWTLLLIAPILEEIAFRGTIQTLLMLTKLGNVHCRGLSGANVVTAMLFALTHAIVYRHAWGLLTVFPGLIFGYFRERYQRLLPAMILHSYYNVGLLVITSLSG